jgi:hypothetical protein
MRIYLPATLPMLRQAVETGSFRPVGGLGFAATRGLAAEYPGADTEDLEYLAMHDAALASLRLIAAGGADPVRVVLAVDDDAAESGGVDRAAADRPGADRVSPAESDGAGRPVAERGDLDRAVVTMDGAVRWDSVASVHLDGGDVAPVIRAAGEAVDAADLGDLDAAVVVGEAEDIDLAWYAPSEIGYLLAQLNSP